MRIHHAPRRGPVIPPLVSRACAPYNPCMRKIFRRIGLALLALILIGGIALWFALRPDVARFSTAELSGRVPVMAGARPEDVPTVNIPDNIGWAAGAAPRAAPGLSVTRFAEGLEHPRSMLVLPNGDVLVAEARGPQSKGGGGITSFVEKKLMTKAGSVGPSPNRISLLRDSDGDGTADSKTAYITGLNSPYGMALVGSTLYVANTDALLAYPYVEGAAQMVGKPVKIADLPAKGSNRHWTKSLTASRDGKSLYVGVGADSNIGENGMEREVGRAAVLEIRPAIKDVRTFTSGIRNPVGIAAHPKTGEIWTVVNERDQLGSDLVPDYLTRVEAGDFFGWPWYYWGGYIDARVPPPAEDKRPYTDRPDYGLGAHVAPLGMTFGEGQTLGDNWADGAFIALHGSWNRYPAAGYSVVFVKYGGDGKPLDALPLTVLDGFLSKDGKGFHGRPADVKVAKGGALLVADDTGNIIWRVAKAG